MKQVIITNATRTKTSIPLSLNRQTAVEYARWVLRSDLKSSLGMVFSLQAMVILIVLILTIATTGCGTEHDFTRADNVTLATNAPSQSQQPSQNQAEDPSQNREVPADTLDELCPSKSKECYRRVIEIYVQVIDTTCK